MKTMHFRVTLLLSVLIVSACRTSDRSTDFDLLYDEVNTAWKMRDFATVKRKSEGILQQYPDYPHEDLKLTLAGAEDQLGNKAEAARVYKELSDNTESATVRNHCLQLLAIVQRELGRYKQAVVTYRVALDIEEDPKKQLALRFGLGLCLQRSQRFGQAKEIYREIVSSAPQSDWARYAHQHLRFPDFYTVQVGAFRQKVNAQKQVSTLQGSGYDVRIDEGLNSLDLKLYYVRVGQWNQRRPAERAQKNLVGSRSLAGAKNIAVVP